MDKDKIIELSEKVKNGTATQEERVMLLKYANEEMEGVFSFVEKETVEEKNDINL